MAILQHPESVGVDYIQRATRVGFADNTLSVVRDAIATSVEHAESAGWLQRVSEEVPQHFSTLVKQLGVAPIPQREELLASYCKGVVASLIERDLLRRKRDLMGSLQRMDAAADPPRYASVQRDLMALEADRRALREG